METTNKGKSRSEWIEAYLAGELTQSEQGVFEKMMQDEPDITNEIEVHQRISGVLRDENKLKFREALLAAEAEHRRQENIRRFTMPKWMRYAAAVIIIAAVASPFLYNSFSSSPDKLFRQYYSAYEANMVSRGAGQENQAFNAYAEGNYELAADLFHQLNQADPDNAAYSFYRAISLMELKNYEEASHLFEQVYSDGNNFFVEQSSWYLALTCIKTGEHNKAGQHLNELISYSNPYAEKAEKLLKSLTKL